MRNHTYLMASDIEKIVKGSGHVVHIGRATHQQKTAERDSCFELEMKESLMTACWGEREEFFSLIDTFMWRYLSLEEEIYDHLSFYAIKSLFIFLYDALEQKQQQQHGDMIKS